MEHPSTEIKNQLYIGWGNADITPEKPVALTGQLFKRISERIQDPLTATVLALETRDVSGNKEQAVMVSCDLIFTRRQTQKRLQKIISEKIPDFDSAKLFLNATHTHTAPGFIDNEFFGLYDISRDEGVMKPSEYEDLFIDKVSRAIINAWESRQPGGFSWGLGNAVTGHNRRTVKFDGTANMYCVDEEDFKNYEGPNDNKVQLLFFWDSGQSLTGIVINSVTTAQVTDSTNFVSADFYHETRQNLRKKYGKYVNIFIQVGAAGDITPGNHEYVYKRAEEEMLNLKGISVRQEMANRLSNAVDEVMPYMKKRINYNPVFKHSVIFTYLPVKEPPANPFYMVDHVNPAEIHAIRLGDIAIATNPFELFIDYGILIKKQSRALLTFIVELSCHHSGYLPTERAIKGGGYSADNYLVGPEGGYKLVKDTVKNINDLW